MSEMDFTILPPGANLWLVTGDRGISSEAIFEVLTGWHVGGIFGLCPPADPSDLIRCEKLLRAVPAFRERLPEMSAVTRHWAGLVAEWDLLIACLDREAPGWSEGKWGRAPATYRRMCEISEAAAAPS